MMLYDVVQRDTRSGAGQRTREQRQRGLGPGGPGGGLSALTCDVLDGAVGQQWGDWGQPARIWWGAKTLIRNKADMTVRLGHDTRTNRILR